MLVTEKYRTTIFAGASTTSRGNQFGDLYRIVMPNTGVTVHAFTL